MSSLLEIQDFIHTVTKAIAQSLEIESTVVDLELRRIAGTVKGEKAVSNGVIQKVIETGKYYIVEHPRQDAHCSQCSEKQKCKERAFINCPIFLDGKVIGVMGLMCYNDVQRERLVAKKESLLSFIQSMCELISSKVKRHEMYKEIEHHNIMLNQIINTVSDGYIIVNTENKITNANKHALRILSKSIEEIKHKSIKELIPDLDIQNVLVSKKYTSYDEVKINGKVFDIFVTAMREDDITVGALISFKKVDRISNRIYRRAFQNHEISFDDIIGKSKVINEVKDLAKTVSNTNANILLLGESGTGKELFARAIHFASERHANSFIPVNCAAIPRDLLESELFGYEAGAFTGASRSGKPGKFELANKGTIFLDEIGDMPFYLQAKILRVLQDRTIEKIGGIVQQDIDVRIIAATNKDLEQMVHEGKFREDLYYRLNVIPIHIPPLRERKEDIQLLTEYFLKDYSKAFNTPNKRLSSKVIEILNNYDWPGNVRELDNIVQYLISVSNSEIIDQDILPSKLLKKSRRANVIHNLSNDVTEIIPLAEIEKKAILKALEVYGDSTEGKLKAAQALGISNATLYRKLAAYKKA